jgi:hypothetical protein
VPRDSDDWTTEGIDPEGRPSRCGIVAISAVVRELLGDYGKLRA